MSTVMSPARSAASAVDTDAGPSVTERVSPAETRVTDQARATAIRSIREG